MQPFKLYWGLLLLFGLFLAYPAPVFSQDLDYCVDDPLPEGQVDLRDMYTRGDCGTANDVILLGARLETGDPCNTCTPGDTTTATLIIQAHNNTESLRFLGLFADLITTAPDGSVSTCKIARCFGPLDGAKDEPFTWTEEPEIGTTYQEVDFGDLTFTCGDQLTLSNILVVFNTPGGGCPVGFQAAKWCYDSPDIDIVPPFSVMIGAECGVGNTANFTTEVFSGSGNYAYEWTNNANSDVVTTATLENVPFEGITYTVTVTDLDRDDGAEPPNLCQVSDSLLFEGPCCEFFATCNLDAAEQVIEGCDTSALPEPFTNATDVFTNITEFPCGELVLVHEDVPTGSLCPDGITVVRTYTLIDDLNGNQMLDQDPMEEFEMCVQNFKIVDTTSPEAPDPPAAVLVQCADDVPAPVDLTAVDNCQGDITVSPTESITPGACPNDFTEVRTWTFTDVCGNTSSVSQTITVLDNTAPVPPTAPANLNLECTEDVPPPVDLTAVDNCQGDITVSPTVVTTPGDCVNDFTEVRTWTFTDVCGNTSSVSQTIVVKDNTLPEIDCPANISVNNDTGQCGANVVLPATIATDNCEGALTVSCSHSSGFFPVGTTTVTCTATDACGNSAMCSFTVTVRDNEPPNLTCPQNIVTGNDPGDCGAEVSWNVPGATDNCSGSGDITVSCTPMPGTFFAVGIEHEVICTATDAAGNSKECRFTIVVEDREAPTFDCEEMVFIQCTEDPSLETPPVEDNCGIQRVEMTETVQGVYMGRDTYTKTWTAYDVHGNDSSCTQTAVRLLCPAEFCSLTQGYYGNRGGKFNGHSTTAILENLLGSDSDTSCGFGDLVIGKTGRSIRITDGDVEKVLQILPGGGPSGLLPEGNFGLMSSDCYRLTKKGFLHRKHGRLRNNFVAQLITLSLNVRLDPCLATLDLKNDELIVDGCFYTQGVHEGDDGKVGTGICVCDEASSAALDDIVDTEDEAQKYQVSASVIAALEHMGDTTVAGLIDLANCALAGQLPTGVDVHLNAVHGIVGGLNEAFDECRAIVDPIQFVLQPEDLE